MLQLKALRIMNSLIEELVDRNKLFVDLETPKITCEIVDFQGSSMLLNLAPFMTCQIVLKILTKAA